MLLQTKTTIRMYDSIHIGVHEQKQFGAYLEDIKKSMLGPHCHEPKKANEPCAVISHKTNLSFIPKTTQEYVDPDPCHAVSTENEIEADHHAKNKKNHSLLL